MSLLCDHIAPGPAKYNQACIDGQSHKFFRPALAPSPICGSNEIAEHERPLLFIDSYAHCFLPAKHKPFPSHLPSSVRRNSRFALWGVHPITSVDITPTSNELFLTSASLLQPFSDRSRP